MLNGIGTTIAQVLSVLFPFRGRLRRQVMTLFTAKGEVMSVGTAPPAELQQIKHDLITCSPINENVL